MVNAAGPRRQAKPADQIRHCCSADTAECLGTPYFLSGVTGAVEYIVQVDTGRLVGAVPFPVTRSPGCLVERPLFESGPA
jgi:hypothetical protein